MVAELCHGGSLRDVVRDQMVSFSRVGSVQALLSWAVMRRRRKAHSVSRAFLLPA